MTSTGGGSGRVKVTAAMSVTLNQQVRNLAAAESRPISDMISILLREACEARERRNDATTQRRGEVDQGVTMTGMKKIGATSVVAAVGVAALASCGTGEGSSPDEGGQVRVVDVEINDDETVPCLVWTKGLYRAAMSCDWDEVKSR